MDYFHGKFSSPALESAIVFDILENDFYDDISCDEITMNKEAVCNFKGLNMNMISSMDSVQFNNSVLSLSPRDMVKIRSIKSRFMGQIPQMIMFFFLI
jgi:hypothetical protein